MINTIRNIIQFDYQLAQRQLATIIIVAVSAALCGYWLLFPAQIALLMPDSTSYIEFQDYRGAGYPFFLAICRFLGFSIEQTTTIQTLLFFNSLAFLGYTFNQRFKTLSLSIALLIGIGLNPAITRYCFSIITESVYFSSLFIFLASILIIRIPKQAQTSSTKASHYLFIGALFAWLILIKPVSWSFIIVPILLIWQHLTLKPTHKPTHKPIHLKRSSLKQGPLTVLFLLLIGFITIQSLGTAYRYSQHQQVSGNSFFGNQLIGKLAFTDFNPDITPYPEAGRLWLEIMQASHQAKDEFIQEHYQRFLFALNTYDFLRFTHMPNIVKAMNVNDSSSAQKELAIAVLKQNPQSYLYDVGLNFYHLWAIGELQNKHKSLRYNQQLDKVVAKFNTSIPRPYYLSENGSLRATFIKPLLLLIALINFTLLLYGLIKHIVRFQPLPTDLSTLLIMACSVNAYFLLTSLLQAALTRYAIIAWPMHLILLFGMIALARNYWMKKIPKIINSYDMVDYRGSELM